MISASPVAQEIHFLSQLSGIPCKFWRHTLISAKVLDPIVLVPKSIFSYDVPANFTWVVTCILFRSLPPVNDPSLTVAGTSSGDFRNDDFDVNGLTKAWLAVNSSDLNVNAITPKNLSAFTLLNKQVLFAFAGGDHVDLIVQRAAGGVPPNQNCHTVFHGYLAPSQAYDCLGQNLTKCDGIFTS